MKRRDFLTTAAGAVVCAGLGVSGAPAAKARPNVILMLADDLGYGDLLCYNPRPQEVSDAVTSTPIRTPALNGLAAEGARLTQFYAAAAICSP